MGERVRESAAGVCVCVRERESARASEREREREMEGGGRGERENVCGCVVVSSLWHTDHHRASLASWQKERLSYSGHAPLLTRGLHRANRKR